MLSRKLSTLLAAAVVAGLSSASFADFVFSSTRTTVGSNDIIVVSILNNGANGTGTQLLGYDLTLTTNTGSFVIDQSGEVDSDSVNDSNIIGQNLATGFDLPFGSTDGTWVRLDLNAVLSGQPKNAGTSASSTTIGQFTINDATATKQFESDPSNGPSQTYFNQLTNYQNQNSLHFVTITTSGYTDTTATPFLNIVVPTGATVGINGTAGGDLGPVFPVTLSLSPTATPEPASLGVLALGGLALLARRRKA